MAKSKKKRTYLPRVGSIVTINYEDGDIRAKKAKVIGRGDRSFEFKVIKAGKYLARGEHAIWSSTFYSSTWKILKGVARG
jgi:hypothetical protein